MPVLADGVRVSANYPPEAGLAHFVCVGGNSWNQQKGQNSGPCKVRSRVATYSRAPLRLLPPRVCQKLLVNSQPAPLTERFGFTSAPTRVSPAVAAVATARGFTYAGSIFPRGC